MSTSQCSMRMGREPDDSSLTEPSMALIPSVYRTFALTAAVIVFSVVLAGCSGSVGAPGEQGPPGPVGAAGEKGETGSAGPAGEQGETSAAGAQGDPGPQGPSGDAGAVGSQGSGGPAGAQGPAGEQGPTGEPGPAGATGSSGPAGPAGEAGEAGEAGVVVSANGLSRRTMPPSALTVEVVDNSDAVGFDTSITIGMDGLPIISYRDAGETALRIVHCGDTECSSGNTILTLDSEGSVGFDTSIIIGPDGLPAISYRDITNGNLKYLHCGNVGCSAGNTIETPDGTGSVGSGVSLAIGSDGLPMIAYRDQFDGVAKTVHCGNLTCSSGNEIQIVDEAGIDPFDPAIAIGIDGFPVIVFLDAEDDDLTFVHCANIVCSSNNNVIRVLDSAGTVGFDPSIAIGADGLPVISYRDGSDNDLKFIHCEDVTCSSATSVILDGTDAVGFGISITIGTDGFPVIAYGDGSNDDLKFVHCGDYACSSGNVIQTIDSAGVVGSDTSITIGADGLTIIAYRDGTGRTLKVAHLSNPLGAPYFRRR